MTTELLTALPPEVEQYRQLIKSRLRWHTRFVHGYSMPWHQHVWVEALEDMSIKRLLIVAPPKFGKSPTIRDYIEWRTGNNPDGYHCIYVSNTASQANKHSVSMRDTVAYNKNYRFLYGLDPDMNKGWGESEWFVKRKDEADKDPTLQATGVGGPILGATVEEVIFDDIADVENMATEYQRQKLMDWVRSTPMSRLVPGGRAIGIMTRWHENDPAAEFEKDGWVVLSIPAVEDPVYVEEEDRLVIADGELTYPEFWTLEALNDRLRDLGFRGFELMFQRNIIPAEGNIFKKEWWHWADRIERDESGLWIVCDV